MLNPEQLRTLRLSPVTGPNRLRIAMDLVGVTQMQLAAAVNVTQSYISLIENGKATGLTLETARQIANYFSCAIEDIFPEPGQ